MNLQEHMYVLCLCLIFPLVTTYNCTKNYSSLSDAFETLSKDKHFIFICLEAKTYSLNDTYELIGLHNVEIRSNSNSTSPAVIECEVNNKTYESAGITFIRATDLAIRFLTIVGCGVKHVNTSHIKDGKFLSVYSALFIQNSTNVSLERVNISESYGIGLLIYDTNGLVNITRAVFINNALVTPNNQTEFEVGGGGVYIEFTNCTPGLSACNPASNAYNSDSRYIISGCIFERNIAFNNGETENLTKHSIIKFGTGGGLQLWLTGQASNNSFQINLTNFTSNKATFGGGLHIESRQNASHNRVEIFRSIFRNNSCSEEGGGIVIGNVIHQNSGHSKCNNYIITNCTFEQNKALDGTGTGGGILGYGSRETNARSTNFLEIHNSSFVNNEAKFGSAIQINKEYYDSITVGYMFTLVIVNCKFTNNDICDKSKVISNSIGAVAMSGVNIQFKGCTQFTNNTSTALLVDGATVEFSENSVTKFQNNSGVHGGAILLIEGAQIMVHDNSHIVFLRNTAVKHGGAIYVKTSTPFDYVLSHVCFVRYHLEQVSPSEWKTNFTFIDNKASDKYNSLFVSTLKPCLRAYGDEAKLLYTNEGPFFHQTTDNNTEEKKISTLPARLIINHTLNANVIPGEKFNLPVHLEDEMDQVVNSTALLASCLSGATTPRVLSTHYYHHSNWSIQLAGKPQEVCELQLQTDTAYQIFTTIQIRLLNCPPGLTYNSSEQQCKCLMSRQNPAIKGCNPTLLRAYYDRHYWIGYELNNVTDLLFSPCPYRYCYKDHAEELLPQNATLLDKFVCGSRKRTGLLCGQCVKGYTVMLNFPSYACHKCENAILGWLFLILSYFIPVSILFYIIMSYNIRITTGPISAYLFFSQIVSVPYYFAFDYSSIKVNTGWTLTTTNVLIAIYSISNLDFFQHDIFSYCLFTHAGTVDILAFKLLLSFYPLLLVLLYFVWRQYSSCKHCRMSLPRWELNVWCRLRSAACQ